MVRAASCCLNNLPPPSARGSSSPSIPSPPTQVTWRRSSRNEDTWKRQCVVGLACMTIGLGAITFRETNATIIMEEHSKPPNLELIMESISSPIEQRWSEKIRACPAWRENSFEITVPENLPRPHARRRWEFVDLDSINATVEAPIKFASKSNPNCFSL